MDPLERVIRPIVEGQIKSFFNDYPKIAEAKLGKRFGKTVPLREFATGSLSKRIVLDLLCPQTRMRLEAAVMQFSGVTAAGEPRATVRARTSGVAFFLRRLRATLALDIWGRASRQPNGPSTAPTPGDSE